jgi:hypothetical protein
MFSFMCCYVGNLVVQFFWFFLVFFHFLNKLCFLLFYTCQRMFFHTLCIVDFHPFFPSLCVTKYELVYSIAGKLAIFACSS